jgi:hypothetical protein
MEKPSCRDTHLCVGPESITAAMVMDSGLALRAPRNDKAKNAGHQRHTFTISRRNASELFRQRPPIKQEGAGDPQKRAQGKPGAPGTRSLACR